MGAQNQKIIKKEDNPNSTISEKKIISNTQKPQQNQEVHQIISENKKQKLNHELQAENIIQCPQEIIMKKEKNDRLIGHFMVRNLAPSEKYLYKFKIDSSDLYKFNFSKGILFAGQGVYIQFKRINNVFFVDEKLTVQFKTETGELVQKKRIMIRSSFSKDLLYSKTVKGAILECPFEVYLYANPSLNLQSRPVEVQKKKSKRLRGQFQIKNISSQKHSYKVLVTSASDYFIRPGKGVILSGQQITIVYEWLYQRASQKSFKNQRLQILIIKQQDQKQIIQKHKINIKLIKKNYKIEYEKQQKKQQISDAMFQKMYDTNNLIEKYQNKQVEKNQQTQI